MYNRYIPQTDGSYQRSRQPEKPKDRPPERRAVQSVPCPPSCPQTCPPPVCRESCQDPETRSGIGRWLRSLLPRDFDTEDLLVILLFLLMSKDREDQNSTLLTLALYLFM